MGLFGKSDAEKEREQQQAHEQARQRMVEAQRKREQEAKAAAPGAAAAAGARPVGTAVPVAQTATAGDFEEYVVKGGDSLSKIAKHHLGDGKRWREIYDANRETIGSNPDLIQVGARLRIPRPAAGKPQNA